MVVVVVAAAALAPAATADAAVPRLAAAIRAVVVVITIVITIGVTAAVALRLARRRAVALRPRRVAVAAAEWPRLAVPKLAPRPLRKLPLRLPPRPSSSVAVLVWSASAASLT